MQYSYIPRPVDIYDQKLQQSGWIAVNLAQQNGSLAKPRLCVRCNARPVYDFHHTNYENPIEGDGVCRSCHRKEHERKKRLQYYSYVGRKENYD